MEFATFEALLREIKGATFAGLDVQTKPSSGIVKTSLGVSVILFSGKTEESGYEKMVKRRLIQAGKDPASFIVGDLPWGEHVPNTPLIMSASGRLYLQTIVLKPGKTSWTFLGKPKTRDQLTWLLKDEDDGYNQGLEKDKRVHVRTYALDSLLEIRLLGETVRNDRTGVTVSVPRTPRPVLKPRFK